jgi:hypothetical protein
MSTALSFKSNTHEVIDAVLVHLFKHEVRRHQLCVDAIATKAGIGWTTFLHKGVTFRPSNASNGARRSSLPEHCWEDIDKHLLDKEAMDWDAKAFWQCLFSLVHPCMSLQDVRDTLPEFLVQLVPDLRVLPRLGDEAFTLDDDRVKRQYEKHRTKMELYAKVQENPGLAQLVSLYHYEV